MSADAGFRGSEGSWASRGLYFCLYGSLFEEFGGGDCNGLFLYKGCFGCWLGGHQEKTVGRWEAGSVFLESGLVFNFCLFRSCRNLFLAIQLGMVSDSYRRRFRVSSIHHDTPFDVPKY